MLGFVEDLWQSVFMPGATPALVLATHVTFALLVILLATFAFLTGSIHIINLFVISLLLWGTLTWFIAELKRADNAEKEKALESEKVDTSPGAAKQVNGSKETATGAGQKAKIRRSRKA